MIGRIIVAIAFIVGGAVTCFVLAVLKGFAASQAGMSAGPVPASPAVDALIPWLAGSYFVVSAIGILLCQSRTALRVAALVAHSLLLIAFLSICAEGLGGYTERFLTGLLTLSFITVLFFSPWLIIWAVFLFRDGGPAEPSAVPNGSPTDPLGDSVISDGPPSVR